jgi:putative transposase
MMVGVKQRYRYRLYPHPHQQVALAKAFGCARVVWNDALAMSRELYAAGEKTSYPVLAKLCITQAKQIPERSWLSGPSNVVLQQSVRDLDQAFRNWWASLSGKRKGPKLKPPRFKKRRGAQSIRFMSHGVPNRRAVADAQQDRRCADRMEPGSAIRSQQLHGHS